MIEVSILSFEPLTVAMPEVEMFVGDVHIALPDVHVKIYDLSMGGILPGAHLGSDSQLFGLNLSLQEPGITTVQMYEFIREARKELAEMWRIVQNTLDEHGALL